MSAQPKVVAIDLDGTILKDAFPEKGEPIPGMKEQLEALREMGWKIAVWTVRTDHDDIAKHLKAHDIPFDYINENPHGPPGQKKKIFADVYVDDRAIHFDGDPKGLAKKVIEFVPWHKNVIWKP